MALLVIAGTSGAGKGTIIARLLQRHPSLWFSVSATTREPRQGEVDGRDYLFVTREEFEERRAGGSFLEWFEVYGQLYGTPAEPVSQHLGAGDDVVLDIDVQGALAVKERKPDATLVFVRAPSRDEQRRRLVSRGESEETIERRLAMDETYAAKADQFDHVVVNDELDRAVDEVSAILEELRKRPS